MKRNPLRSLALGAVLCIAVAGTASAGVIDFSSLGTTSMQLGNGITYNFTGTGLTANALVPSWNLSTCADTTANPCLYYKYSSSASETGIGLEPNINNEVFYPNGVGLTMSQGYISGLEIGSVQSGESWQVMGCAANYTNCVNLYAGVGGYGGGAADTVTLTGLQNYASYLVTVPCDVQTSCSGGTGWVSSGTTGGQNNIVLMSVTTVPEPGTLALLAAGLAALGFALRRRARQS